MPIGAGVASGLTAAGALAAGGAAVSTAIGAKSAEGKRKQALADLMKYAGANSEAIYGSTPEFTPPDYTPLFISDPGYKGIVADILAGDQENLPAATSLSAAINQAITKASRERIQGLDPSFFSAMDALYATRNEVLSGRLPYSDALAITADRTRLANDLGASGTAGPQIAADLGLKKLDLMTNIGPNLLQSSANILNLIDPIQRHTTPTDMLLTPAQGVQSAINENQFAANFGLQTAQEAATFGAMPDPRAQGIFNLMMMQAGLNGSSGGSSFGPILGALGTSLSLLGNVAKPAATPFSGGNFYLSSNGTPIQYFGNAGYPIPKALPV